MANKQKYTKSEMRMAIDEEHGIILKVAKRLNCTTSTVYNYIEKYNLNAHVRSSRRYLVDLAEDGLLDALKKKHVWAITFTLKTLGKDDYSERSEMVGANGAPIVFQINGVVTDDE